MDLHLEKVWLNSAGALQHPHHLTLEETERAEIMGNTSLLTRGNALSVLSVASHGSHLSKATSYLALLPLKGEVQG